MASPEIVNLEFYNLHTSVTNLERALEDADRQKTAPKGARALAAHQPVEELRQNVAEDLGKVLNSPLRPAMGSVYGCLPLEAVQPMRQLHEMLLRAVGPNGNPDILNDADTAADLHHRVQALVASVNPNHPFLKVEFEFKGSQRDGGDDDEQQQTPGAKGKGKQVADDEEQHTPKAKGKDKQVVGTQQGKVIDRIEESRVPLANKLLAMFSTYDGSIRRESLKRTYPRMSYPTCGRQTGLARIGRRPAQQRRGPFSQFEIKQRKRRRS